MSSWNTPKPRLCPELHHLIIDFVVEASRGLRDILGCALVNKNWNAYATRWIWRSIVLSTNMSNAAAAPRDYKVTCGILSALIKNPQLRNHIHHLCLDMPNREEVDPSMVYLCYARRPDFFALCQFLPPPTTFTLSHSFLTREDGCLSTGAGGTRMARLLAPFFNSTVLTTLTFTGTTFPLELLKSTPNLDHLELFDVERCALPEPNDVSSPTLSLPFRLKSILLSRSFRAGSTLISTNAQIFSELKVLRLFPGVPQARRRTFVKLLSVASGTLKDLYIRKSGLERNVSHFCLCSDPLIRGTVIQDAYDTRCSIDWMFDLRGIAIDFIFWKDRNDRWIKILDILDERRTPLRALEKLELKLVGVPVSELREIFDVENRGWRLARQLLSPEFAPLLQHISIRVAWYSPEDRNGSDDEGNEFDHDNDQTLRNGMALAIQSAMERCLPTWKGDERGVQTMFSANYYDQQFWDDDSYDEYG